MVLVGIISQFVPRMMSVGYTNAEALTFMSITSIIAIPGSYLWGWLDSKFGTKSISIVFAFSYVAALVLLITSFNIVCVWLGCIFAGLGIGGLLNLLASISFPYSEEMGLCLPTVSFTRWQTLCVHWHLS